MVAKISHGASLYGALAYNHEKVFQGTAEILSGHRMISDRPGLPSEDMRLALLSFENHHRKTGWTMTGWRNWQKNTCRKWDTVTSIIRKTKRIDFPKRSVYIFKTKRYLCGTPK